MTPALALALVTGTPIPLTHAAQHVRGTPVSMTCRAVDGDTIFCGRDRIRIADIDAPEMRGRCPYETALARRARDRLAVLLREPFTLQRAGRNMDRYGRLLRVVVRVRDRRSVGDVLVREGLARTWTGRREPWC